MQARAILLRAFAATVTAAILAACGAAAHTHTAPVRLRFSSPGDGARVEASDATVSGVVSPRDARVLVVGHAVDPSADGSFSTSVPLVPGTNLVDVIASAPHAQPVMTTIRVIRYVLVSVPDVTGENPSHAAAAIRNAGLRPQLEGDSNPFAFLLPFSEQICAQSPNGGARVSPDSTVTLQIGKLC